MAHWLLTVDVSDFWNDESLTLADRAELAVVRVKGSNWRRLTPYPDAFDQLVDRARSAAADGDIELFRCYWDELYDLADSDGVWIETH